MPERYLIWSNEHRSWWRSGQCGYTGVIGKAGRYKRAEAEQICADANRHVSIYHSPNEVMVLAPECLETTAASVDGGKPA